MLRFSRIVRAVTLNSITFVENPVNRIASVNVQLSRSDAKESYNFAFRVVKKANKKDNLQLRQVPHDLVTSSPLLDALFPDKGRIYAGTEVYLTSVNAVSGNNHKKVMEELKKGTQHTIGLSIHMGPRRTTKQKTRRHVAEEVEAEDGTGEEDEVAAEGTEVVAEDPVSSAVGKRKRGRPAKDPAPASAAIDDAPASTGKKRKSAKRQVKAMAKQVAVVVASSEESTEAPPKKKRGRKPKNAKDTAIEDAVNAIAAGLSAPTEKPRKTIKKAKAATAEPIADEESDKPGKKIKKPKKSSKKLKVKASRGSNRAKKTKRTPAPDSKVGAAAETEAEVPLTVDEIVL